MQTRRSDRQQMEEDAFNTPDTSDDDSDEDDDPISNPATELSHVFAFLVYNTGCCYKVYMLNRNDPSDGYLAEIDANKLKFRDLVLAIRNKKCRKVHDRFCVKLESCTELVKAGTIKLEPIVKAGTIKLEPIESQAKFIIWVHLNTHRMLGQVAKSLGHIAHKIR